MTYPMSTTKTDKNGRRENDGDTWVEAKAILNESTGETRSYFWSMKSKKRLWDRPPRNAGKVIYWMQIAKYNSIESGEQVPQKIAHHRKSKKTEPKTTAKVSSLQGREPQPSGRRRSDPLCESTLSRSVTPPPERGLTRGIPMRHRTPPPRRSTGSGSPRRKEAIASLFVMAPQGSLTMDQVVGAVNQEDKPPINIQQSLPPPDGDEYDYEIDGEEAHAEFNARPSSHVQNGGIKLKQKIQGDGDLWVEAKVLLDERTGKTRSYFYSKNTQRRVWDEPPSGAGKVIYLRDVKRVYMRDKSHTWRMDSTVEQNFKKNTHQTVYRTAGKRQCLV